ncbi:type III-A CRISPR-associated protein Csm2 [Prosthecochloris marina]|uniref:CRISPR system Cms protein Csm2 n=1 Tax=Prosthecochloris marina TaxID=2017681 RepID=A0A317TAX5_9CHLB|nr:type III-A CRISPR-associated protein Csm2 [Prosthecochloris marina]PWW82846.1 type III-A CRISPR-associated protein Csm2 [Prosthecochloris marina]
MSSVHAIKQKTSKYNANLYDELEIDDAIEYAETIAKHMRKVKNHQLRRFFSAIKNIQKKIVDLKDEDQLPPENYAELQMLRPQLANTVGRLRGHEKFVMQDLLDILQPVFKTVKKNNDFVLFVNFFESIVAYHKVYAND